MEAQGRRQAVKVLRRDLYSEKERAKVGKKAAAWYLEDMMTIRDIAFRMGHSYGFVRKLLLDSGVTLRGKYDLRRMAAGAERSHN